MVAHLGKPGHEDDAHLHSLIGNALANWGSRHRAIVDEQNYVDLAEQRGENAPRCRNKLRNHVVVLHGALERRRTFEKRWNPMLQMDRDHFIAALADVAPKPADMERILLTNQGRAPRAAP